MCMDSSHDTAFGNWMNTCRVTNPHEFTAGGVKFLGTSGQNIDDIYKYRRTRGQGRNLGGNLRLGTLGSHSPRYVRKLSLLTGWSLSIGWDAARALCRQSAWIPDSTSRRYFSSPKNLASLQADSMLQLSVQHFGSLLTPLVWPKCSAETPMLPWPHDLIPPSYSSRLGLEGPNWAPAARH